MSLKLIPVLLIPLFLCSACFETSEELSRQGARLVNQKRDWQGGKALFIRAIEKNPDNAKAHKNLALVLTHENRIDEAIKHLEKAVAINPDYGEAQINLSLLYFSRKNFGKAVEHMDLAVDTGYPVDLNYRKTLQKYR